MDEQKPLGTGILPILKQKLKSIFVAKEDFTITEQGQARANNLSASAITSLYTGANSTATQATLGYNSASFTNGGWSSSNVNLPMASTTQAGCITAEDKGKIGEVSNKQDKLSSGTNIKTINGSSILGPGDLKVDGLEYIGEGSISTIDSDLSSSLINTEVFLYANRSRSIVLIGFKATCFNISKPENDYVEFAITIPDTVTTKTYTKQTVFGSASIMDRSSYKTYGGCNVEGVSISNRVSKIKWLPPLGYRTLVGSTTINSTVSGGIIVN